MRKPLSILLTFAGLLLVAATATLWQRNQQLATSVDNARKSQDAANSQYSDAINAISAIQDSLGKLGVPEANAPVLPGTQETERGFSAARGREALDRIALLKAGITRTKARIRQLESRLHANGLHIAGLESMLNTMRRTVAEREAQYAAMTEQVESLNTQVSGLTAVVTTARDSIQTQSQTIETQRQDLGRVFYVIGSRQDLERAGVVKATGGVLGMGKTLLATGDATPAVYKTIDTDAEQVLSIPASRARVLSAQPTTSYTLVAVGKQMELHIVDPREFRTVKRVVIMTQS